ncbi:MAG: epoxyqueuosine reductase QueH [Oscillospiraceae bacterium]|nr:epoxyqueuosine reductase QueH [Oscillospiraceae bacterium]
MKTNYQIILDRELEKIEKSGKIPALLLHSCCAPCSSYVLEYLSGFFDITIFFFNPNISSESEFAKRSKELKRLIAEMPLKRTVKFIEGEYDPESFFEIARGLEELPEGGERCFRCYELRLKRAAQVAKDGGFDYFTSTLSISPHKNAEKLNAIGGALAEEYGVSYLFSDFKKRNGYKRSCELSEIYGLYRQNYCGCIYSKAEAERREKNKQI